MFDEEAAAGDDFSDIENRDEQVEPLKEKRVLDLGPFNDEDEDIELLKSGGAAEEQLKKKKVKKRRVFNENMLTSAAGLERMYEEFPDQCRLIEGNEAASVANLMRKYKEWAFQLYPNLAFNDMMNRCQALGSKAHVRGYMDTLRERERHRYLRDVLGVASEDIIMSHTVQPEASHGPGSPSPVPSSAHRASGIDEDPEEAEWGRITGGNTSGGNDGTTGGADDDDDDMDYDWEAIDALATQEQSSEATARKTADEEALEEWMRQEQEVEQGRGEDEDEAEAWAEMQAMEDEQRHSIVPTQEQEKEQQQQKKKKSESGGVDATDAPVAKRAEAQNEDEDEDDLEIVLDEDAAGGGATQPQSA